MVNPDDKIHRIRGYIQNAATGQTIARVLGDARRVLDESENLYRQIEPFLVRQIVHHLGASPDPEACEALCQYQQASTQPFWWGEVALSPLGQCSGSKREPDTACKGSASPELLGESLG